ncbi:MAG: hypothetical protein IPH05_06545 [Flavobacteriales bacterium]|nr:hypothetical protein [Flavobacteriales bacterium]MBK6882590.1 hypothetical protein [Flavobacteriales bacterium]MBK7101178.1 hypothetical protein [Flavobacteriales bacterium]MBK7111899.1 hypothetical protein [Flavobacteriales bacterium]MBK7482099.1 hypothetical protein [Flavobacteriales bacterium]
MDIKGVIADQMGHFSVVDLPGVLFVVLFSTGLTYVMARFGIREEGPVARRTALWGAIGALSAALVRSQLPVAVLFLAAAILVGRQERAGQETITLVSALAIGIGCGTGASVVVALVLIPYLFILRWAYPRIPR